MADGINRIGTGSSYGLGAFFAKNPEIKEEQQAQQAPVQPQTVDVDPSKVMDYLNANAFTPVKPEVRPVELAPEVAARAAAAMADFERFMSVATEEVGDESLALLLADAYSEK